MEKGAEFEHKCSTNIRANTLHSSYPRRWCISKKRVPNENVSSIYTVCTARTLSMLFLRPCSFQPIESVLLRVGNDTLRNKWIISSPYISKCCVYSPIATVSHASAFRNYFICSFYDFRLLENGEKWMKRIVQNVVAASFQFFTLSFAIIFHKLLLHQRRRCYSI